MPHPVRSNSESSEYAPNEEEDGEEDEALVVDDPSDNEDEGPPAEIVEVGAPPPPGAGNAATVSLRPLDSIWESPYINRKEVNGVVG